MNTRITAIAWLAGLGCTMPATSPQESIALKPTAGGLRAQAKAAYDKKDFRACADAFAAATKVEGMERSSHAYDAACCLALANQPEEAIVALQRAVTLGYRDPTHLFRDSDLAGLHSRPEWVALVSQAAVNEDAYLKTVNVELMGLFHDDQADRRSGSTAIDWSIVGPKDARRRQRVSELLDAGVARVADDYYHAAMVFQHGQEVADYQRSHQLALQAVKLDPSHQKALWLAAASKDRELMTLGKPQRYGTQFTLVAGRWELYSVDPSVTDEERAKWNVPPLSAARQRAERMSVPASTQ